VRNDRQTTSPVPLQGLRTGISILEEASFCRLWAGGPHLTLIIHVNLARLCRYWPSFCNGNRTHDFHFIASDSPVFLTAPPPSRSVAKTTVRASQSPDYISTVNLSDAACFRDTTAMIQGDSQSAWLPISTDRPFPAFSCTGRLAERVDIEVASEVQCSPAMYADRTRHKGNPCFQNVSKKSHRSSPAHSHFDIRSASFDVTPPENEVWAHSITRRIPVNADVPP